MIFLECLRANWLTTIIGFLLLIAGTTILVWNEGRAVNKILALDEALNDAITVRADEQYERFYEEKLIHLNGPITTGEPLTESDYNIMVQAVKLKRRVQMYQWVEETVDRNFGETVSTIDADERTYYYSREWRDQLIDSRSFYIRNAHENPKSFPIESKVQIAGKVHIGQYLLGAELKNRFQKFVEVTADTRPDDPQIKLHSGIYYHCNDIWNPEVGDVRIQFYYAGLEGSSYTVIGKLENGKIVPYETTFGRKILLIFNGELDLDEAIKIEHKTQRNITWGFRFFGWALLFFSATCSAAIMRHLVNENRFLLALVPDPTFPVSTNICVSFSLALVITSIAWIFHRPWLGGGLLFAAVSPFLYCARSFLHYQRLD
uniref:Putative golgi apparatus n=1 Tax=Corethrella appendiculata TaxID=1370023 RepID=U5EWB1_9DIPT